MATIIRGDGLLFVGEPNVDEPGHLFQRRQRMTPVQGGVVRPRIEMVVDVQNRPPRRLDGGLGGRMQQFHEHNGLRFVPEIRRCQAHPVAPSRCPAQDRIPLLFDQIGDRQGFQIIGGHDEDEVLGFAIRAVRHVR